MNKKPTETAKPKETKWTEAFIKAELDAMLKELEAEDKSGKYNIIFKKQLCVKHGYSAQTWAKHIKQYEGTDWYQEKWSLVNDILWCRLMALSLKDSRKTGIAIWLDKTNYGTREQQEEQQEMKVNLTIEELK